MVWIVSNLYDVLDKSVGKNGKNVKKNKSAHIGKLRLVIVKSKTTHINTVDFFYHSKLNKTGILSMLAWVFGVLGIPNNKSIHNLKFEPRKLSLVQFKEPHLQFLIDFKAPMEAFKGTVHVTTHRFICLVQCGLSLASPNPSGDANTLLRYPSTWQIRLLAGWLAECWSRFSRSDYRVPLIVCVCVCVCEFRGNSSYTLSSYGFLYLLSETLKFSRQTLVTEVSVWLLEV